jgi:hypothetical protein
MIVIALLLIVVAAAFGIDLIWKNNVTITNPTVFGERLGIHSAASLFVVGAITGAAVVLGVALLLWGVRRKGANAVNRHHERRETRRVREDRDRLRSENEQPQASASGQSHAKLDQIDDTAAAPGVVTASDEPLTETAETDQPHPASSAPTN